ncbi:MAG TPA: O-antigen ligase family protein [Terracidiphilus sp.]|jgi:O-antigen ligase
MVLLTVAILAVLQEGRMRKPGPLQWLALSLYLWFCCSYFWSIAPDSTGVKLRGYFQEMMLVWLVWELMETPDDLRNLMRVWLAGSWVLAILTLAGFALHDPASPDQIRFVAAGQDPNDVARFIDLGLPIAALLLDGNERRAGRLLAAGYIPLGFACVLLTASRSGFLVGIVALTGCGVILFKRNPRALLTGSWILPALGGAIWLVAPHETLLRLGTIAEQLQNADLNQRVSIWSSGWHAFLTAPIFGHGAGTFVTAARLAPEDTAHNTILSALVEEGLIALAVAGAIVAYSLKCLTMTAGALRKTLFTLMAAWLVGSLVGTVGESRTTWLLLAAVALAGRLADEAPRDLERTFSSSSEFIAMEPAAELP